MGPREIAAPNICIEEFSGIVQQHRPLIFRFLLASLRDMDLAETLTQECFLKAYRNWLNFRGESTPRTWLMRIAINLQRTSGATGGCSSGAKHRSTPWIWTRLAIGWPARRVRRRNKCLPANKWHRSGKSWRISALGNERYFCCDSWKNLNFARLHSAPVSERDR
jgi:hypothetical protein